MDEDDVARSAGTDKKMAYVAQTYGKDFVVLETEGLDGHKNLNSYRLSKEVFTEAYVSFGLKKHSFLLEPLSELTLRILQVTNTSNHYNSTTCIRRYATFFRYNVSLSILTNNTTTAS